MAIHDHQHHYHYDLPSHGLHGSARFVLNGRGKFHCVQMFRLLR